LKKKGKLPDEPAPKKKSLKNFFANTDKAKEKDSASIEDDNVLKNILGELENTGNSIKPQTIIKPKTTATATTMLKKQPAKEEIDIMKELEGIDFEAEMLADEIENQNKISNEIQKKDTPVIKEVTNKVDIVEPAKAPVLVEKQEVRGEKKEMTGNNKFSISAKSVNMEAAIFNELQGIDFEAEFRAAEAEELDWNTVSQCICN
jgi:hypothetical protein